MNLPNAITVARILAVPVFLVLAYGNSRAAALGAFFVFLAASLSDSLDGYLARRNDTTSRTGEFLDPLADKLLIGAALIVLVDIRLFPAWAALVIGVREIAVQVLRTRIVRSGGTLPASLAGKTKTVLQIVMVGWWLLPWAEPTPIHYVLMAAALVSTLWSGAAYFLRREARIEGVAS